MSNHVFSDIYLHITWHTKGDLPMLNPEVEKLTYGSLRNRCVNTKGVFFHKVGGTETHIHLVLSIEPFVCISDMIGDIKGACSREINKRRGHTAVTWQRGYGVVSFGRKNLPFVLEYVANQKTHHAERSTHQRLELTTSDCESPDAGQNG